MIIAEATAIKRNYGRRDFHIIFTNSNQFRCSVGINKLSEAMGLRQLINWSMMTANVVQQTSFFGYLRWISVNVVHQTSYICYLWWISANVVQQTSFFLWLFFGSSLALLSPKTLFSRLSWSLRNHLWEVRGYSKSLQGLLYITASLWHDEAWT